MLNPPLNTIWLRVKGVCPNAFLMYMGDKIRSGYQKRNEDCPGFLNSTGRLGPKRGRKFYVTPAFSGVPKQRGDKIRSGCLTPTFSGAQKRGEVLRHPCVLGAPQARGHNQKNQTYVGATMMPLVSQSMGLQTPK